MFMASLCRHLIVVLLVVTLHKFSCHVSSDNLKIVLPLCNTSDYHLRVKVLHIWFFCCVILECPDCQVLLLNMGLVWRRGWGTHNFLVLFDCLLVISLLGWSWLWLAPNCGLFPHLYVGIRKVVCLIQRRKIPGGLKSNFKVVPTQSPLDF